MSDQQKKYFPIILFLAFVFFSNVILPLAKSNQFLFFYPWRMYSNAKPNLAVDLRFDGHNESLLFRDQLKAAKRSVNVHALFLLVNSGSIEKIRTHFGSSLQKFCNCHRIDLVHLQGTLYEHVVLKKNLAVEREEEILP